ncbi:hypothetical protein BH10PSE12_BH10PSE12_26890 [soil metagenome]
MTDDSLAPGSPRPLHVCFFFNAQRHQLLHGIATAVALARMPGFEVYVVSPSQGHVDYARMAAEKLGGAPIIFIHTRSRLLAASMRRKGSVIPPKLLSLTVLARWLNGFDAIALPERTSIILRRFGVRRPRFIHLDHGAGDRAAGFDPRIRQFDFVLMAGPKHRERLMGERLIDPQAHAVVGYPKFEAADAIRDKDWRPFANDLPTILYNPHFSSLGSWASCGEQVLAAFAGQDRYNLILAPHVRMLDGADARKRWAALLDRYEGHPHIHIDRGSDRAIDMTHTSLADLYLGDVSSQVYEYLRTPRPCLFLNPKGIAWEQDENYAHWHFGPVVRDARDLIAQVDRAIAGHAAWQAVQQQGIARTFLPGGGGHSAARAIGQYLRHALASAHRTGGEPVMPSPPPPTTGLTGWRRMAWLLPVLFGGWLLHEALKPSPTHATASPFVDRAVASHRITLLRQDMRSQEESEAYDPAEIQRATGIAMPVLPAGWTVGDAQLYPSTQGHLVQLFLRTAKGERLSLVAMRIETPAGMQPVLEDRATEQIVYWENGDFAFAIVAQIPSQRLLTLATQVASRASEPTPWR